MYLGREDWFTLGPQAAQWIEEWCAVPDGPQFGNPLRLSRRQIRFACEANLFQRTGSGFMRVRRRAFYVGVKAEGKTPLVAGLAAFRFRGPSIPYDLDEKTGMLVSREDPASLVQVFANSELQGLRTTWRPLVSMLKNGKLKGDKRLWVGDTMIRYEDRLMTYDPLTLDSTEGARPGLAVIEESQYMRSVAKREAIEAVVRNTGKTDGVVLFPTNAPERGGGSYADDAIQTGETGDDEALFVLYPKLAAPLEDFRGIENKPAAIEALAQVYGESADPQTGWVDLEGKYKDLIASSDDRGRRYYLNESTSASGAIADPALIEEWARPGQTIPDGSYVALGFDGSESDDATALVAVSLTDPRHVETLGIWSATPSERKRGWRIPKNEVKAAFLNAKDRFKVEIVAGDPSIYWKSFFSELADDWGHLDLRHAGDRTTRSGWGLVCEVWLNNSPKVAEMVLSEFVDAFEHHDEDGNNEIGFTHDGNETLVRHMNSLVYERKRQRYKGVGKKSQSYDDQNDAGIAVMLGLWAAAQFDIKNGYAVKPQEEKKQQTKRKSRASKWGSSV